MTVDPCSFNSVSDLEDHNLAIICYKLKGIFTFGNFTSFWSFSKSSWREFHNCLKIEYKMKTFWLMFERGKSALVHSTHFIVNKGLFPYYIIIYNKQGSFQMITKDYSKGPRVVKKDYVLWKIQNMQESVSIPSSSGQSQFSIRSLVTMKLKQKYA